MEKPRDPIGFELFKNTLLSIADEMALTILRTAYSGVLKDNMDYSTAFCDGSGRTIAQGLTLPAHLSSFPDALAATIARFGDRMHPGDVYCLNDPFEGGMHIPDVFVLKPIFHEGERLAFAATICHQTDMGGRVAGSNASDSTEIYQEGLRIPPVKMYEAGEPNETLFRLLEKNIRMPARVFGDLRAQLAACHIAEAAFLRLVARHGAKQVQAYMDEILDYTERLTRASLSELPDGEWSFEDWIDDDGIDYGKPIRLFVTLRKAGDSLVADWTGTSAQVKGAINNTASFTKAATFTCLKSVLAHDVLCNAGFYRAIEVIAPPGTIANGVLPAASAARGLTGFRMLDTCFGALAQMLPDRSIAASEGGNTGVSIGGYYPDRRPFIFVEFICSAWGGRAWADGLDGNANMLANMSLPPVEITEAEQPLQILCTEFIQDVETKLIARFKEVRVGGARIALVKASGSPFSIFGDSKDFSTIEVDGLSLPQEAIADALFATLRANNFSVERLVIKNLELPGPATLPKGLTAEVLLNARGAMSSAVIRGPDNLHAKLLPKDRNVDFDVVAGGFPLPLGPQITLSNFAMKGTATPRGMTINEWGGALYSGGISGRASVRWGGGWQLDGILTVRNINAAVFAPALLSAGNGEGTAKFSMSGPDAASLASSSRLDGNFTDLIAL